MMEFDIFLQDHHKGRDQDISNLMKRAREAFNIQFQVPKKIENVFPVKLYIKEKSLTIMT